MKLAAGSRCITRDPQVPAPLTSGSLDKSRHHAWLATFDRKSLQRRDIGVRIPELQTAAHLHLHLRALDNFFESKSLLPFEIANGHDAWWPALSEPLKGTFSFSWPDGPSGRRQIIGKSDKRGFHWHYGVSVRLSGACQSGIAASPRA